MQESVCSLRRPAAALGRCSARSTAAAISSTDALRRILARRAPRRGRTGKAAAPETRGATARVSETADALLDWLHTQRRTVTTGSPTLADAAGPAEDATAAGEASADPAPAADPSPADRPIGRGRMTALASRRPRPDATKRMSRVPAGCGRGRDIIPWQLDLAR